MVSGAVVPSLEEVQDMQVDQLRATLVELIKAMKDKDLSQAETVPVGSSDEESEQQLKKIMSPFSSKNVSKPTPWDGEAEAEFKGWNEKLTTYMAAASDRTWKVILKTIQELDSDDSLEEPEQVRRLLAKIKIQPDLEEDLQEALYDQLTQYSKEDLLADIQMAGPRTSFESYRKAFNHGKKKTAENVHRARNRVTRPDIAESMPQLEEKYKRWKKDIAYLKEIDAYDLRDNTMISILLDFMPDEVHKELTNKHETTGPKASTLRSILIDVEKIIQREKDREESRKDCKTGTASKHVSQVAEKENEDGQSEEPTLYIWDQHANYGYGGFIALRAPRYVNFTALPVIFINHNQPSQP